MASWSAIAAYVIDFGFGYQSANKHRENMIVLASRRAGRFLGGSRTLPNFPTWDDVGDVTSKPPSLGPHDALDYVDVEINGTHQGGITYQARVEVRTLWPGCSITPKIRNITAGTDAGTGVACTAANGDYTGTNQRQTIAITLAAGVNKYRLQYTLGKLGLGMDTWCTGEIESFTDA
jgi:hypothetical protein